MVTRHAKRILLETLGWLLLVVGMAAIFLPGPGLLALFAGLALLSQQYEWAERRVEPVKLRAFKGAAEGVSSGPRILMSLAGVAALGGCGVLWILSPPQPTWWPFPDWLWLPGGFGVGVTQAGSALVVIALMAYSWRQFHGREGAIEELARQVREADAELAEHKATRKDQRKERRKAVG